MTLPTPSQEFDVAGRLAVDALFLTHDAPYRNSIARPDGALDLMASQPVAACCLYRA